MPTPSTPLTPTSTTTPLNNTHPIPLLGFGVYQIPPATCALAVQNALSTGYRHIDTAQLYRNESQVGLAIAQSPLPRSSIFITTKQGILGTTPDETYNLALGSIANISGRPNNGYVDLLLIHIPHVRGGAAGRKELWQTLERLYDEKKVKAIGVSNYGVQHLEEMKDYAKVWPPHVNQIELHPWRQQRDVVAYCEEKGIVVAAYSPLAEGARLDDAVVGGIAKKHGRSAAQVLVRYGLQKGWAVLSKSERVERMRENRDVFGFALDAGDMEVLDGLDEGEGGEGGMSEGVELRGI